MALQFYEAPDYASILERDYEKQNRGFERREQAEQVNDQRRIQNAGVPLKLINSLLKFSATAKQLKDKLDQEKLANEEINSLLGPDEDIDEDQETDIGINILDEKQKTDYKVSGKVEFEDGDKTTAIDIRRETPKRKTGVESSILTTKKTARNLEGEWLETGLSKQLREANSNSEAEAIVRRFKHNVARRLYDEDGITKRILKKYLLKELTDFGKLKLAEKRRSLAEKMEADDTRKELDQLTVAFKGTNPGEEVFSIIDINQGKHGKLENGKFISKISDSVRFYDQKAVELLKAGLITPSQYFSFLNHKLPNHSKPGSPLEPVQDIWPKVFAETKREVTIAIKTALDEKETNESNYRRTFTKDLEAQENERIKQGGTKFTEEEIVEYYDNNYDPSQGGPLTQQMINEWWTAEEAFDVEHDRVLNEREKLGIPISKKEANKFNDPDKRAYWSNKAISLNTSVPSKAHLKNAKALIKAHSVKHNKLEGSPDPSTNETYVNNTTYGELEYRRIYADEIKTASSANAAHLATMKQIKDDIFEGNYDTPPTPSISAAKQRELTLKSATEAIKLNPDIINTGIIYGTEKILEEVRANPNEIHVFYKQLADKYPGVQADQLQYAQLEIAHKLFGGSKPVKSEILKAWEKLDPGVQFLLSTNPTLNKVTRAKIEQKKIDAFNKKVEETKIEAFKDDGEITYDEIEFLLEELHELLQITTPELKQTTLDSINGWDFVTTM